MAFTDYFSYTLGIGVVIMGIVIGIFNQAGIGPVGTGPSFTYNETVALTLVTPNEVKETDSTNGAYEIAATGFLSILNGFKTMLLDFVPYCDRFGIPVIISGPAQALIWLILGYDMLLLKKEIWG